MKKTFDVVGKRKYFYTFSLAVIIIAIILSFVLGMGVAIEFKGGTIITYSYTGTIDADAVAAAASEAAGPHSSWAGSWSGSLPPAHNGCGSAGHSRWSAGFQAVRQNKSGYCCRFD